MSTRTCQYRQDPRRHSNRQQFDDDSLRAPSITSSHSLATTKKKPKVIGSISILRGDPRRAPTTFATAAAASTTSSTASMSTPLLGASQSRQHVKKYSRGKLGASFQALPSAGSSSSRMPLSDAIVPGKESKKKRLSRTIQSKLARMSSMVKRGKKFSKSSKRRLPLSTSHSRYDSNDSSSLGTNSKGAVESVDADPLTILEQEKPNDTNTRMMPLLFDETKVTNHFQDEASSPPFNRNNAARLPIIHSVSPTGSSDTDKGYLSDSNHSIPSLSESPEVSTGDHIIASTQIPQDITNTDEAADSILAWGCLTALLGSPAPRSVLVAERNSKKITPINLWQGDDEAVSEDIDNIPSLPQDADDASALEIQVLNQGKKNREKFTRALKKTIGRREEGETSTPEKFYEAYYEYALSKDLADPAPIPVKTQEDCGNGDSGMQRAYSSHSIPSICSENEEVQRSTHVGVSSMPISQHATNVDESADSILAWGCLTALLGAPAPKSVLLREKKQKKRMPVNLWPEDADVTDENLDDILSLPPHGELVVEAQAPNLDLQPTESLADVSDNCSIPSLSPEVAQLDESNKLTYHTTAPATQTSNGRDIADSALARSTLAAILGSPAPSSAVRKSVVKERCNLWGDGGESDLLPEIDEQESGVYDHDESDSLGITSIDMYELADTSESDAGFNGFVHAKGRDKEAADSTLAWGALGMLLGSPAPQLVSKKKRKNLWEDGGESDLLPEIDEQESEVYDHDESDSLGITSIDMYELADSSEGDVGFNGFVHAKVRDKEAADSALAWGALGMLLGAPAPQLVSKKNRKNLWEDGGESDLLPEIDEEENEVYYHDESDSLGITSIDMNELTDSSERDVGFNEFVHAKVSDKESADSALAWGALGMLLGAPAPQLVSKKNRKASRKAAKDLWEESGAMGNDGSDTIPSIHLDEDDIDSIPSPLFYEHHGQDRDLIINLWDDCNATEDDLDDLLSFTQGDTPVEDNNEVNEKNTEQDYHDGSLIAQKVGGQDESYGEEDAHSIPSLSATFDWDDNGSSSLLSLGGLDDLSTSPKSSSKGITDSVLAWGALAACLGAPAPKASIRLKRKRVPRDLWGGEANANGCKPAYLTLPLLDDNESN